MATESGSEDTALDPEILENDIVALMDAGAYFIPNQMNFSNPRPAAVLVDKAECRVLREREAFEDIVRLDELPVQEQDPLTERTTDQASPRVRRV